MVGVWTFGISSVRFSHSKKCSLFVIIVKSLKFSKIRRMNAPFFRSVDGRKWWRHSCERAPQLKGTIQLICDNITSDNIAKTEMLLLNDNVLHSIDGISRFSVSPLELLNLSNNSLESIPEEVFVFNPSYCSLLR